MTPDQRGPIMNLDAIQNYQIKPIEHAYTAKDSILYALGLGYGDQPADPNQLQFVYERGLKAVPSMSVVLAHPGFWVSEPSLGIDWIKILHGEQSFEIFQPLPAAGTVRGTYEVTAVEDRGAEKGAILHVTKRLVDVVAMATREHEFPKFELVSGAFHDALFVAKVCPVGMVFVRCRDGVSHNPSEYAAPRDVAAGARVLMSALLQLAAQ